MANETKGQAAAGLRRTEAALDAGWRFHLGEVGRDRALDPAFEDRDWADVRLPHDWAIHCPSDPHEEAARAQGSRRRAHVGWYRNRLRIAPKAGERVRLRLDGAYRHAEVWVNGASLGVRPSGYATRIHDITDHLREDGDQLVAVRCDNTGHDADRWYCGAGLYRRVWLTTTGDVAIAPWGVSVTTPEVSEAGARVVVEAAVANRRADAVKAVVGGELLGPDGSVAATLDPVEAAIGGGGEAAIRAEAALAAPALWSPESPALYAARLRVTVDGEETDGFDTVFGVRSVRFSVEKGLELNGRARTMRGVCLHHDLGCLGTAFFAAGWERRLRTLKELGCDAIRTSHNPPDPALLDLCDRLGFLVIDEVYDKWRGGCSGDHFDEWWRRDVEALVLRDRNHPCVIVWSIGNEVEDQCSPQMLETSQMLSDYVKELEPTRPTLVALRPFEDDQSIWTAPVEEKSRRVEQVSRTVDIVGLNYQDQWYDAHHALMPDRVFIATEAFHFFQHRDNASWAFHAENPWFEVAKRPYVAGQFLWTGIEYLGEASQGWPTRGWRGAPVDTAGWPKPRASFHASVWREAPVVRAAVRFREGDTWEPIDWSWPPLVDHWNLPIREREIAEVWVFSNAHRVELFLNDGPQGARVMAECPNRIAQFWLPYAPGTLLAVARDEDGAEVARHAIQTAGAPARLRLSADKTALAADGQDLAHVTVEIVDEDGVRVPGAAPLVGVEVRGAARLEGLDNGDLTCPEPYEGHSRSARAGRCLAVVRAGMTPGPVAVTAVTAALESVTLELEAR